MRSGAESIWRRLPAILCLLIFLSAATPLGAISTALFGAIDSEHHIRLAAHGSTVKVILGHDSANPQFSPTQPHCIASRFLILFARNSGPEPDHVLSFNSGSNNAVRTGTVEQRLLNQPVPPITFTEPVMPPQQPDRTSFSQSAHSPPPHPVAVVRSTVFLI